MKGRVTYRTVFILIFTCKPQFIVDIIKSVQNTNWVEIYLKHALTYLITRLLCSQHYFYLLKMLFNSYIKFTNTIEIK